MLSVVVPIFNEHDGLDELYRRLLKVMEPNQYPFEIVLVDDGSTDGSREIEAQMAERDPRLKIVQFSRNFGHQMALSAGIDYAQGQAIIMMDADMQHPPELIPAMIAKWEEGFDVVTMKHQNAATDYSPVKTWSSRMAYRLLGKLAEVEIVPGAADFRLIDRRVADTLREIKERERFLRGLVPWVGFRHTEIEYQVAERFAGRSKYSVRKMMKLGFAGLTNFSSTPLYLSAVIGLILLALAVLYGVISLIQTVAVGTTNAEYIFLVEAMAVIGGIQLICLGIIGLYLGRVYDEVKRRPLYVIDRLYGFHRTFDASEDSTTRRLHTSSSADKNNAANTTSLQTPGRVSGEKFN